MRILFLSTWFPYPPTNGSKLRAYYLLQALAACHEVTALAFSPPSDVELPSHSLRASEHPVTAVGDDPFGHVDASEWERYVTFTPPVYRPSVIMQEYVQALRSYGQWDAAVAVQMYTARYLLQVDAAARIMDVDTALTYQMRERFRAEQGPRARLRAWISMQKARYYETSMLRNYQAATVVWNAEADLLHEMVNGHGCSISVIPNGVDCIHNQPLLNKAKPYSLVYNGSLTYSANFDAMQWFLAGVYPQIKAKIPAVTLTITGSIDGVELTQLRLDDSVCLSGFVEDIRVPVAQATVCVTPIRQGGGTRVKILEAMALGTPVVSTPKGAEGLNVTDGEHLLLADDPDAFAHHVVAMLNDPHLRTTLAANARQLVEQQYNWQSIGNRFVDLIDAVKQVKPTT